MVLLWNDLEATNYSTGETEGDERLIYPWPRQTGATSIFMFEWLAQSLIRSLFNMANNMAVRSYGARQRYNRTHDDDDENMMMMKT